MNYKLVQTGLGTIPGKGDFVTQIYDVIETKTNQIIARDVPGYMNEAKNRCRHLNLGGGFDGWTPAFFLERIPVSESPNDVQGGNEWISGWTESKWSSDPK